MSGDGLFGIGTSALLAYQRALQVAGHNIANVGTEGYSRQQVEFGTRIPQPLGSSWIGNGAQIKSVERVADQFVELRLVGNTSAEAYHRTYADFAARMDNLVADPETGLAPALDSFFAAIQEVATDPTSTAARQQLLGQGESLASRFGQMEGQIDEQRQLVNGRITGTVEEINQLARGIAELNQQIIVAKGRGTGSPNDLLDSRDQLVRELAQRVSVTTLEQEDGSLNVYAGRGQSLVVGVEVSTLSAEASGLDPDRIEIGYRSGGNFLTVTETLTGGELGALLDVRDAVLNTTSNSIGRLAIGVTEQVNQVHTAGMDLNGQLGTDFFGRPTPLIITDAANTATGAPALSVIDSGALEASDYELSFDGTNWSLLRLSDGQQVASLAPGSSLDFDGLNIDLSGISGAAAGDHFLLRPMRVATELQVLISDPRAIAAALPVRAAAATGNTGAGSITDISVLDSSDPQLQAPVDVQFTGGNFVAGAVVVPLDPSGETTIDVNGWSLVVRGTPADGDIFSVRSNAGGVGDNRAALELAGLANRPVMNGGTTTLTDSFAEIASDVGVKTQRAQISSQVQAQLLQESQAARESASDVNLDEEAANLLRYQQAYEASAQVIAAAGTMFDALLLAVSRN